MITSKSNQFAERHARKRDQGYLKGVFERVNPKDVPHRPLEYSNSRFVAEEVTNSGTDKQPFGEVRRTSCTRAPTTTQKKRPLYCKRPSNAQFNEVSQTLMYVLRAYESEKKCYTFSITRYFTGRCTISYETQSRPSKDQTRPLELGTATEYY